MAGWTSSLWSGDTLPLQDSRLLREVWDAVHERAQAVDWLSRASESRGKLTTGRRSSTRGGPPYRSSGGDVEQMYDVTWDEVMGPAERIVVNGPGICGPRGGVYYCSPLALLAGALYVGQHFFQAELLDGFAGSDSLTSRARFEGNSFNGVTSDTSTRVLQRNGIISNRGASVWDRNRSFAQLFFAYPASLHEVRGDAAVAQVGVIARNPKQPRRYVRSNGTAWVPFLPVFGETPDLQADRRSNYDVRVLKGDQGDSEAVRYRSRVSIVPANVLRLAREILDGCQIRSGTLIPVVDLDETTRICVQEEGSAPDCDDVPLRDNYNSGYKASVSGSFGRPALRRTDSGVVQMVTPDPVTGIPELIGDQPRTVPAAYPHEWVFTAHYVGVQEGRQDVYASYRGSTLWEDKGSVPLGSGSYDFGGPDDTPLPFVASGEENRFEVVFRPTVVLEDWRPAFAYGADEASP